MSMSNSTGLPDEYSSLLEVGYVIVFPIVTIMVMCIVYGFYVLLFGLCIYVLQRSGIHRRKVYIAWASILFSLSTSMVVVETLFELHQSSLIYLSVKADNYQGIHEVEHNKTMDARYIFSSILLILANAVADSMLIHRCYVTWGSKKRVAVPLVFLSCAITVVSAMGTVVFAIGCRDTEIEPNWALFNKSRILVTTGFAISAAFNLALTLLTAGRIWWITRTLNPSKTRPFRTINKIILESGMLYPLVAILNLCVFNFMPNPPFETLPLVVLAAGIAPTLIIVLTRLSIHVVEDSDATYSHNNNLTSFRLTERSFGLSRGLEELRIACAGVVARNDRP
ncbi:hypothetical protein PM082_013710 [Marasmius tenuissimus]|nr:hypothetical protein PM082_013710 [Marasmius tenuissimus]